MSFLYPIVVKLKRGPLPPSKLRLCLKPVHTSSVSSVLSLRWLADIQWPISVMHSSSWQTTLSMSPGKQCKQRVISKRVEVHLTFSKKVIKVSYVHMNMRGPKTEPCRTEPSRWTTSELLLPRTTLKDLSDRYEQNYWMTTSPRPNWRSRWSIRRSWSMVSNAAVKSSKYRVKNWPVSAAKSRTL